MKELPKIYDPQQVEGSIYEMWQKGGYFHAKKDPDKKPFTIVMPPPNVTGQLHMVFSREMAEMPYASVESASGSLVWSEQTSESPWSSPLATPSRCM